MDYPTEVSEKLSDLPESISSPTINEHHFLFLPVMWDLASNILFDYMGDLQHLAYSSRITEDCWLKGSLQKGG